MRFENDVKMYGIQTVIFYIQHCNLFENDVKMYGIQTQATLIKPHTPFENDVKMYGIQTDMRVYVVCRRLRMM